MTEYRECRQTVQRPVVETNYVDQPVTEYRQVVENKTAEVPTCTYQNVTEMRTVQRDCGHWVTQCYQRPQMTPCQYDNRPDLFGFINRTGYSLRMAFTPQSWSERVYVPNVVAQQVPVTRQVAVRGTQTISYQVAKVVPICTTRKVAVNTVRMVSQEIVTQRPVTVFKTVPMGSSLSTGRPRAAARRRPLPPCSRRTTPTTTAIKPKNSGTYCASPRTDGQERSVGPSKRMDDNAFDRKDNNSGSSKPRAINSISNGRIATNVSVVPASGTSVEDEEIVKSERPIGRWVARKKTKVKAEDGQMEGPSFPEIAQTGVKGVKKTVIAVDQLFLIRMVAPAGVIPRAVFVVAGGRSAVSLIFRVAAQPRMTETAHGRHGDFRLLSGPSRCRTVLRVVPY